MSFSAEKLGPPELETSETIEPEDEVEIINYNPDKDRDHGFFRNGDHGHVVEVDPNGLTIELLHPRKKSPFERNRHWVPWYLVKKFDPSQYQNQYKDY